MSQTPSPSRSDRDAERLVWFNRDGWVGWQTPRLRAGRVRWVRLVLAERWPSEAVNRRERSVAYRVEPAPARRIADELYVKHTREPLLRGLLRLGRPQSWRVARIGRAMREAGIGVPTVWFAGSRLSRPWLEHAVVLAGVDGVSLRALRRSIGRGEAYDRAVVRAAEAAAHLHACGFGHGDFVPGNVLLGPASDGRERSVTFIDNDRTRRVLGPWRLRARCRNTAQMAHRLRLLGRWADARTLLRAYASASGLPSAAMRRVRRAAVRRARRDFGLDKARGLRQEMDGGPIYRG
ncbi:MAG: lipopolysaccharide kinase InaA family protein [Planctomycetota bacterium]